MTSASRVGERTPEEIGTVESAVKSGRFEKVQKNVSQKIDQTSKKWLVAAMAAGGVFLALTTVFATLYGLQQLGFGAVGLKGGIAIAAGGTVIGVALMALGLSTLIVKKRREAKETRLRDAATQELNVAKEDLKAALDDDSLTDIDKIRLELEVTKKELKLALLGNNLEYAYACQSVVDSLTKALEIQVNRATQDAESRDTANVRQQALEAAENRGPTALEQARLAKADAKQRTREAERLEKAAKAEAKRAKKAAEAEAKQAKKAAKAETKRAKKAAQAEAKRANKAAKEARKFVKDNFEQERSRPLPTLEINQYVNITTDKLIMRDKKGFRCYMGPDFQRAIEALNTLNFIARADLRLSKQYEVR